MINNIQYMFVIKRGKNDYFPIDLKALKEYKNEDLNELEGIDSFTSKTSNYKLINDLILAGIVAPEDYFMYFTIIYKEKGKYREIKEGIIFEDIAQYVSDNDFINIINNNYTNKNLLNYIINLLNKNIDNEINKELIFILKNIDMFAAKSKNAIKAALDKYKELPYKEKRMIAVNTIKKYYNLLSK